jgi:SAM-dependent MidA family methyltransferase
MHAPGSPRLSAQQRGLAGAASRQSQLHRVLVAATEAAGGWLAFDRFMALALYAPGLGYYAGGDALFGSRPEDGSDFITAPELSPLFGRALAAQVAQALHAAGSGQVLEFGAGTGALAEQILQTLGHQVQRYAIVELSAALRQRQQQRLAAFADQVVWLDAWPDAIDGVVLGNEVLDAMPVQLLHWDGERWLERGVALLDHASDASDTGLWAWVDRPTTQRPPHQPRPSAGLPQGWVPGTVTEIHLQAEAFVRSLAQRLRCGAAFFIDYGFPDAEYYNPQRVGGTLMCHRAHRADSNPLLDVGLKDITAHLNFSALALAAQDAGLAVLGYTSQAHFLINCGLPALLQGASPQALSRAQKLLAEHEMGELFKVLGLARGLVLEAPLGFVVGDRSHRL